MGFVLGCNFSSPAILVSGLLLAIISAVVLQKAEFGALAGIATMVACLTVNQISYLIGVGLMDRAPSGAMNKLLPRDQAHDDPSESCHNDVAGEHKQQKKTPPRMAPMSDARQSRLIPS